MDERDRDRPGLPQEKGNSSDSKGSGCLRQGCFVTIMIAFILFIVIPLISNTTDESTDNGTSETSSTTPTETTAELPEDIQETPSSEELIIREYSWVYGGEEWTWELRVLQSMYDYFKEMPRPPTMNYSVYVTNPLDDPYIDRLVEDINEAAAKENYSEYQTVEFATTFVQNLPYTVDSATSPFDEYP